MADHQQGTGEPLELVHQPPLGRHVEMIGGLVEDQRLGPLEEDPDQVHPATLSPREALDVLEQQLLAETEPVREPCHHGFGLVAAALPELLLEVGVQLDVLRARVFRHLCPCLTERVVEHIEPATREHVGETARLEPEALGHRRLGQEPERSVHPDVPR